MTREQAARGPAPIEPLFYPGPPRPHTAGGREFVVLGHDGAGGSYCVDVQTGEIVITSLEGGDGVGHVNASPEAFERCAAEFRRRCPFGVAGTTREELELMSAELGRALLAIDGSVFDEDPGFWFTLLHDVALGDYADV